MLHPRFLAKRLLSGYLVGGFLFLVAILAVLGIGRRNSSLLSPAQRLVPKSASQFHAVPGGSRTGSEVIFLQASDIHISLYFSYHLYNFQQFVNTVIPAVNPAFVLITGDLTDGKTARGSGQQNQQEWIQYSDTLKARGYYDPSFVIDLPGNHDFFGVGDQNQPDNYFRDYAVWGHALVSSKSRQFVYSYSPPSSPGSRYDFIIIDGALTSPGLRNPLNFDAHLTTDRLDALEQALQQSKSTGANLTSVLGHYPSFTFIRTLGGGFKSSAGNNFFDIHKAYPFMAYFCGHLHTAGMYARVSADGAGGLLELEADDMKGSRAYRVLAFDNDLFSFSDVFLGSDAIQILLTNPKPASLLTGVEPWEIMASSSHIRVFLLFPPHRPVPLLSDLSVTAEVAGDTYHFNLAAGENSSAWVQLWVAPWSISSLSKAGGLADISVRVSSLTSGAVLGSYKTFFSLDGTLGSLSNSFGQTLQLTIFSFLTSIVFSILVFFVLGIGILLPQAWVLLLNHQPSRLANVLPPLAEWERLCEAMLFVRDSGFHGDRAILRETAVLQRGKLFSLPLWNFHLMLFRLTLIPPRVKLAFAIVALDLLLGPLIVAPLTDPHHLNVIFLWGILTAHFALAPSWFCFVAAGVGFGGLLVLLLVVLHLYRVMYRIDHHLVVPMRPPIVVIIMIVCSYLVIVPIFYEAAAAWGLATFFLSPVLWIAIFGPPCSTALVLYAFLIARRGSYLKASTFLGEDSESTSIELVERAKSAREVELQQNLDH